MSAIVVTGALRDQMKTCGCEAEIRDEAGELIGRFLPYAAGFPDLGLTEKELARRLAPDAKTHSTAEVLAYCKGLVK